jgi:hypothetical protein
LKKHAIFSVHSIRWMVLGVCMIAAALLPGAGLAKAAYPALSSQSDPALNLLSKTENGTKEWAKDYLHKKRQYTRFIAGLVLDPIFDDQAIRMGLGRGVNDTVQVVDCDGGECLYFRGYLLKKQSDQKRALDNRQITGPSDLKHKVIELKKKLTRRFSFS